MCPLSCWEKSFFSLSADVLLITGERPNFLQKSKNNTKQPFHLKFGLTAWPKIGIVKKFFTYVLQVLKNISRSPLIVMESDLSTSV